MPTIRPACSDDLSEIFDIIYEDEVTGDPNPPPRSDVPTSLRHELATGAVFVAEQDGHLLGFAGALTRGHTTYLADLFVRPQAQSGGLGAALLQRVFPAQPGRVRFTLASTDRRALALYVRAGLRPQWPNFLLRAIAPAPDPLPATDVTVSQAQPGDPELLRLDAELSGRDRAVDHQYWLQEEGGLPLWFHRRGTVVGYGYARSRVPVLWYPEHLRLGPIGARTPDDALGCVFAAIRWAQLQTQVLRIDVPGPHPCLAPLLAAHFQIVDVVTFLAETPIFDPQRYLGSGDGVV